MKCKHKWIRDEANTLLSGKIDGLAEEFIYICKKCGKIKYKKSGKKLNLLK